MSDYLTTLYDKREEVALRNIKAQRRHLPPKGYAFKDKSKYSRKTKHKKREEN